MLEQKCFIAVLYLSNNDNVWKQKILNPAVGQHLGCFSPKNSTGFESAVWKVMKCRNGSWASGQMLRLRSASHTLRKALL